MRWYFDFISPYAYLQSTELEHLNDGQLDCVPVLFAGLLNHFENVGPAEIAPKRDWTFKRVAYLANKEDIPLKLPPHHPFNPLPLLRLSIVLGNDYKTVQRLFKYVWVEGNLPAGKPFTKLLDELGVDPSALSAPQVKQALAENGKQAVKRGVFGVPSIEIDKEVFWGYDSTAMALDYHRKTDWPEASISKALSLPVGTAQRKRTPNESDSPRLPLLPIDLNEPAALVEAIRNRRGGELIELDRLLLYSEPLAAGWNIYIGNVREHFTIAKQLRELAICTVAVVNKADYEFNQHAPIYVASGGTQVKADALKNPEVLSRGKTELFDLSEQLTIELSVQMTRDVRVKDQTFSNCQTHFSNTELVELVATIAAYNMVSRFLVAFKL